MRAASFEATSPAGPANRAAIARLLDRLCAVPDARTIRCAFVAALTLQLVLSVAAGLSLVALHADGAWMVFAVADGDPWQLKWVHLASRAAAYVGVVLPVQGLAALLGLNTIGIAVAYGFLFNALQLVQATLAACLAWRRFPSLLVFPLVQYLLSTALGYGFMSEAYLGPGFFWIALFLLLRGSPPILPFAICFAGVVFSHELMLPSSVLLAALLWFRREGAHLTTRERVLLSLCVAVVLAWAAVRLAGGGADSDGNAITTLDPRRLVRNPTLWILLGAAVPVLAATRRRVPGPSGLAAIALACASLPFLLAPWLNVADGRYDSARTLTGLECLLFGGWAILVHVRRPPALTPRCGGRAAILIAASLGVVAGADGAFLHQWAIARDGFARLAANPTQVATVFLTPDRSGLTGRERRANDRLGFEWTWPFRSADLAGRILPQTAIVDTPSLFYVCDVLKPASGAGATPTRRLIARLRPVACAAPPPRPRRRLFQKIIDLL